jgi:hypothetical protein
MVQIYPSCYPVKYLLVNHYKTVTVQTLDEIGEPRYAQTGYQIFLLTLMEVPITIKTKSGAYVSRA